MLLLPLMVQIRFQNQISLYEIQIFVKTDDPLFQKSIQLFLLSHQLAQELATPLFQLSPFLVSHLLSKNHQQFSNP